MHAPLNKILFEGSKKMQNALLLATLHKCPSRKSMDSIMTSNTFLKSHMMFRWVQNINHYNQPVITSIHTSSTRLDIDKGTLLQMTYKTGKISRRTAYLSNCDTSSPTSTTSFLLVCVSLRESPST